MASLDTSLFERELTGGVTEFHTEREETQGPEDPKTRDDVEDCGPMEGGRLGEVTASWLLIICFGSSAYNLLSKIMWSRFMDKHSWLYYIMRKV